VPARTFIDALFEDNVAEYRLCQHYPNLANLLAEVFGGYPSWSAADEMDDGVGHMLTDLPGEDLREADTAAYEHAGLIKRWGGIPSPTEMPEEYAAWSELMAAHPGLAIIQDLITQWD
jgi:hypothetical protein